MPEKKRIYEAESFSTHALKLQARSTPDSEFDEPGSLAPQKAKRVLHRVQVSQEVVLRLIDWFNKDGF
jgi:hypothetical protein